METKCFHFWVAVQTKRKGLVGAALPSGEQSYCGSSAVVRWGEKRQCNICVCRVGTKPAYAVWESACFLSISIRNRILSPYEYPSFRTIYSASFSSNESGGQSLQERGNLALRCRIPWSLWSASLVLENSSEPKLFQCFIRPGAPEEVCHCVCVLH